MLTGARNPMLFLFRPVIGAGVSGPRIGLRMVGHGSFGQYGNFDIIFSSF